MWMVFGTLFTNKKHSDETVPLYVFYKCYSVAGKMMDCVPNNLWSCKLAVFNVPGARAALENWGFCENQFRLLVANYVDRV